MANIKISPTEVRTISKSYKESSEQIDEMLTKLDGAQSKLESVWEGEAFNAFADQYNALKPKVKEFGTLLDDVYKQLNKIAEIIEETDQKIGETVKKGF